MSVKFSLMFYVSALVTYTSCEFIHPNNVCRRISAYSDKYFSNDCWYNPEVDLTVPGVIKYNGYQVDEHDIVTEDGYKLKLFRIPSGKSFSWSTRKRQPVFLQHGLLASPAAWVLNGNSSIGFILADKGYDVWLGSSRGSKYGKGHFNMELNDMRYWNFSFHEMGMYDLPASLDYMSKVTGRKDIIYIGHSMGSMISHVYASELPDIAGKRLKLLVSLAPTVFLKNLQEPYTIFAILWPFIKWISYFVRLKEVLANTKFSRTILSLLCTTFSVQVLTCETLLFLLIGFNYNQFRPDFLPVLIGHFPAGTSVNTLTHLVQVMESGRFAHFDYGRRKNRKYYNSTTSPDYELSKIKIPTYIMYSANDKLTAEQDVFTFFSKLPRDKMLYKLADEKFNHFDFYFAKDTVPVVVNELLQVLDKYRS